MHSLGNTETSRIFLACTKRVEKNLKEPLLVNWNIKTLTDNKSFRK